MACKSEHVGIAEIADRLGIRQKTVAMWRYRGSPTLPEPCCIVSKLPAWRWSVVEQWAKQTGRLPEDSA
jgi:hypothetical protein